MVHDSHDTVDCILQKNNHTNFPVFVLYVFVDNMGNTLIFLYELFNNKKTSRRRKQNLTGEKTYGFLERA